MMLRVQGRTILWCACLLLTIGVFARGPLMLRAGAQAGDQSTVDRAALRAMYDDDAVFEQLSGARRSQLERLFGPKGSPAGKTRRATTGHGEAAEVGEHGAPAGASPLSLLTEPVVNNVAADTTAQDTQSETTIVLGSGSTVVAAFNNSAVYTGTNNHFTGRARSTNSGASWSDGGALPDSINGDIGTPVLARDNTTGRLYLSTLCFNLASCIEVFRSDDNGATWNAPINAMPVGELDKEWIAVDNFGGGGRGNVYLVARDFAAGEGMKFARSTDAGSSWSAPQTLVPASGQGGWVAVGTDHSVHAFWYDSTALPRAIKERKSTDQGLTFAAAVTVTTLTGTGDNGDLGIDFRTNSYPQAVVNPSSGNLYVVYNDKNGADRGDVYLRQSTDGGATWSTALTVNTDATGRDQTMPTIAVTPDGSRIFVGWYDRRSDPANSLLERWGAIATITGATITFGPNFRISNGSFPVVVDQDPILDPTYMGDYDQAVADNSYFYTTWGDNRLSTPIHAHQPDVRFEKIPIAGPGGIVSYASSSPTPLDTSTCNNLSVTLTNVGTSTATGVSGTLSTAVAGVVIDQATSTFPNLAPGATATSSSAFKIHFAGGFVCVTNVDFTLSVTTVSDGNFSIPFRLGTTSTTGAPVRFNNDTSTPLADPGITDIPFTVSGLTGGVAKVTVSFYATHPFDSDLQISLIGPDNTAVILSNQRGGSDDNFGTACSPDGSRTTFDDAAGTAIGSGTAPFVGTFRPDQALSAFNNKSGAALNGTWKLRFDDMASPDSGVFFCGSIVITPAVCVTGGSCGGGQTFTDDPLTVGVTVVKAVHIAELRTRIDAQRARFGLGGYAWTDQPLTAGTVIKSQHVLELRTALNQAYTAHGVSPPAPSYTDPGLPGGTLVKAQHITELRNAVIALEGV